MFPLKHLSIALVLALTTQGALAEYKTKSKFSKSFKCTTNEAGGYNSSSGNTHNLVRFKPDEEYFLTHISSLPMSAVRQMISLSGETASADEAKAREQLEKLFISAQDIAFSKASEKGSYFMRASWQDPRESSSYTTCEARMALDNKTLMSCDDVVSRHFLEFNERNKRFNALASGWWILGGEKTVSTIIMFGTCDEYYP